METLSERVSVRERGKEESVEGESWKERKGKRSRWKEVKLRG